MSKILSAIYIITRLNRNCVNANEVQVLASWRSPKLDPVCLEKLFLRCRLIGIKLPNLRSQLLKVRPLPRGRADRRPGDPHGRLPASGSPDRPLRGGPDEITPGRGSSRSVCLSIGIALCSDNMFLIPFNQ